MAILRIERSMRRLMEDALSIAEQRRRKPLAYWLTSVEWESLRRELLGAPTLTIRTPPTDVLVEHPQYAGVHAAAQLVGEYTEIPIYTVPDDFLPKPGRDVLAV